MGETPIDREQTAQWRRMSWGHYEAPVRRMLDRIDELLAEVDLLRTPRGRRQKCARCGYRADQVIHDLAWSGAHAFEPITAVAPPQ